MTPTATAGGRSFVKWIFLGVTLILALSYGSCQYSAATKKAEEKKAAQTAAAVARARASEQTPRVLSPAERPWSFRTVEIPPEGLPVYLYWGWKDFAFGGNITITTPGGRVLKDQPGVNNQWGFQADGVYVFRADPVGSKRSVQILNRW